MNVYIAALREVIRTTCTVVDSGCGPKITVGRYNLMLGQITHDPNGQPYVYKTGNYPGSDPSWERLSNTECREHLKSLVTTEELRMLDLQQELQQ